MYIESLTVKQMNLILKQILTLCTTDSDISFSSISYYNNIESFEFLILNFERIESNSYDAYDVDYVEYSYIDGEWVEMGLGNWCLLANKS
jgi:hypothetical protein